MRLIFNKLIVFISALAILSQPLFFSTLGILKIDYVGKEESPIFIYYQISIFLLSLSIYFYSLFNKGIFKQEVKVIIFILLFFVIHFLWIIFDPIYTILIPNYLIFFIVFGIPGILSAITILKLNLLNPFIKFIEILLLIIALGLILYSVVPTLSGKRVQSLAGATYQVLSYYSSFTFGMLLVYNTLLQDDFRLSIVNNLWFKILSFAIIFGCVLGTFIGAGRGAFLLLLAYLGVYSYSLLKDSLASITPNTILKFLLRISLSLLLIILFITYFWEKDFVQSGFIRATQFISPDGIDLQRGSSGRDEVYSEAIKYISDSPIIGYGPFMVLDKTLLPHNIFLEILLQTGFLGMIFTIIISTAIIRNAIKNWTAYSFWVFCLMLYPIVMLMFSRSYMHTSIFLFAITFFTVYKDKLKT